jgi:voltage-dependent potassium channel beta subunit
MEYRRLGKSGLRVSELSYGSWVTFSFQLDKTKAKKTMKHAYDAGINFFDNAEVYAAGESEKIMGAALKELGLQRDTYTVSSKVFFGGQLVTQRGLNAKHIRDGCDAALKRLRLNYLDLFFCHRPDFHTPVEETVRAMDVLVKQGKILYWGTSEWPADRIREAYLIAYKYGLTPPSMEQPEYNMFNRMKMEKEYLGLFDSEGMGTTIWSPLASGVLTGKYNSGVPKGSRMSLPDYKFLRDKLESKEGADRLNKVKRLGKVADRLGVSLAQLSLAWCLKNKNVSTVILGATNTKQLDENLKSIEYKDLLTDSVMGRIESILKNMPAPDQDML